MKRFIIFLVLLITFVGLYNISVLQGSFLWFFGDNSYQKSNFSRAMKQYTDILKTHSWSTLLEADILYNLGNVLYRLGEEKKDVEKIKYWKEAIGSYTKSLALRIDKDTEENLTFVKKKLQQEEKRQETQKIKEQEAQKKLEKKDEKLSQDETKKDESWKDLISWSGTQKQNTNTSSKSDNEKQQSEQNWSNGWSYNPIGWQDKDGTNSNLSDNDKQDVKRYLEELKQFAKQNGKLLNPEKPWDIGSSISDQIRNFFWNDSFFQDMNPNNDGKRDW